jgi:hypothetical protein
MRLLLVGLRTLMIIIMMIKKPAVSITAKITAKTIMIIMNSLNLYQG